MQTMPNRTEGKPYRLQLHQHHGQAEVARCLHSPLLLYAMLFGPSAATRDETRNENIGFGDPS